MKMTAFLLAILLPLLGIEDHDVSMATFRLSASGDDLELEINFDKDDYASVHKLKDHTIAVAQFEEYLNTTTCWTFNGEKLDIKVQELSAKQHHVAAICRIQGTAQSVREIMVENEFLLDVEDQTNVVVLDLNGKSRGFRMHSGRKEIVATY